MNTYVIAEAGVNHNGNPELAFKLVDAAASAGANAVKFQTFKSENLITKDADKADYQKNTTGNSESQFDMLKRLELSHEVHRELVAYAANQKIDFLSTAFDLESLDFLVANLGLKTLKIPSGEITNGPLLLAHAVTGCKLIVSTGMASIGEIEEALAIIAFGLLNANQTSLEPSREKFLSAYYSFEGQKLLREKVTLLHCTTEYPAPYKEINLKAMQALHSCFNLPVGYSDHTEGITVPIIATTLGAAVIEKHFTLDKSLPGPDHKASLEPNELREMVRSIKIVHDSLGSGLKAPVPSELKNRAAVRKSLVAAKEIKKGEIFTRDNITIKRPGVGKSPMEYWSLIGEVSTKEYGVDELIS